jgi:hypothetical protein
MSRRLLPPALFLAALLAGCLEEPPSPDGAFFEPRTPVLRTEGPVFTLEHDFVFVDSLGKRWLAPQGTKTDGATIPQWALSIIGDRMNEEFRGAALVHDAYCQGGLNGSGASYRKDTWQNVHRMFYEACVANGVDPYRARLMFSAVWVGGPRWDDQTPALTTEQKMAQLQAIKEHVEADAAAHTAPPKGDYSDLTGLIQTMSQIEKDVKELKITTARIETKTDQILTNLEAMSASFANLEKQGGIIAAPKSPEEHYHNARIHELGGDYGNTRQSYLAYFASDLDYLDPHLRYLDFLKLQEGRAGARETYQLIVQKAKSIVPAYAASLLWERDQRIAKLTEFIATQPDFVPAYYHLSEEYSAARIGTQSLEDKRLERLYLEKFNSLASEGKLLRWFIDRSLVSAWQKDAESRLAALKSSVSDTVMANPVELRWMSTNGGWMGAVSIAEPALEIFWKGPGQPEFKSTGPSPSRDPRTGKPYPNMTITLPENTPKAEFQIKYINASGQEMGPFALPFDPALSSLVESKHTLELTRTSWVSFRDWDGKLLLYFSHLLSYRGVLKEIRYGVDKDIPDTKYPFPPYDKPGFAPISEDVTIHIEVPATTQSVTVQLTFRDGTQSEIVRFNR